MVQYIITTKHCEITPDIEKKIQWYLPKLERYSPSFTHPLEIVCKKEKLNYVVTTHIVFHKKDILAHGEGENLREALQNSFALLFHDMTHLKEKLHDQSQKMNHKQEPYIYTMGENSP